MKNRKIWKFGKLETLPKVSNFPNFLRKVSTFSISYHSNLKGKKESFIYYRNIHIFNMLSHRFNNHSNSEDEVEYVLKDIEEKFIDWLSLDMNQFAKRKRIRRNRIVDFTETPWALDVKVLESQKDADTSYEGRQFRRKLCSFLHFKVSL